MEDDNLPCRISYLQIKQLIDEENPITLAEIEIIQHDSGKLSFTYSSVAKDISIFQSSNNHYNKAESKIEEELTNEKIEELETNVLSLFKADSYYSTCPIVYKELIKYFREEFFIPCSKLHVELAKKINRMNKIYSGENWDEEKFKKLDSERMNVECQKFDFEDKFFYSIKNFKDKFSKLEWINTAKGLYISTILAQNNDNLFNLKIQNKGNYMEIADSFVLLGLPTIPKNKGPLCIFLALDIDKNQNNKLFQYLVLCYNENGDLEELIHPTPLHTKSLRFIELDIIQELELDPYLQEEIVIGARDYVNQITFPVTLGQLITLYKEVQITKAGKNTKKDL